MLVCAFLCAYCTRGRGGSAHPAFPAPSVFWGERSYKASGVSRGEIMEPCLQAKPSPSSPVPVIPVARAVGLASDIDFAITSRNEVARAGSSQKSACSQSKPGGFHGQCPRSRYRSGGSGGAGGDAG